MTVPLPTTARVCVIGAGPCGIAAAKALLDAGYDRLTVYDRQHDVGGNWLFDDASGHSSVFETTHIISSKRFSEYDDYPMPADYPDYPSHRQLADYFQGYAAHFGLYPFIEFGTDVITCTPRDAGGWDVRVANDGAERTEAFDMLVVANGHHSVPRWPDYPGELTAEYLHSHHFKRAAPFRDRRVLVIGGGNSACDVAVETARVSARTDISWRRGYRIIPKFLFGLPGDVIHHAVSERIGVLPLKWRFKAMEWLLLAMVGPNRRYGLPAPDHPLGATHPTANSELLYALRHGRVSPRPDIARWDGQTVTFTDGTQQDYDAVIACTGYHIAHPFLPREVADFSSGPVPLYLKMLPADRDDLAFIGLFQPLGCIWPSAALQAKVLARRLRGTWQPPGPLDALIADELANPDVRQLDSPRHTITVDAHAFRKRLLAQLPALTSRR